MKNLSYLFLSLSFGLIGYFFYNAISDAANGVTDFVADSTRLSHPASVLFLSAISLFIGFIMNKKAATVKTIDATSIAKNINLERLVKRIDNIEDRLENVEENEVKTSELLTQLLSDENGLTHFNPNEKDFNPLLTHEFELIPLDKETNRLELELPVIVDNRSRKGKKG